MGLTMNALSLQTAQQTQQRSAWKPFLNYTKSPLTAVHNHGSSADSPLKKIWIHRNRVNPDFYERLMTAAGAFAERAANPGQPIVHINLAVRRRLFKIENLMANQLNLIGFSQEQINKTIKLDAPHIVNYKKAQSMPILSFHDDILMTFGYTHTPEISAIKYFSINGNDIARTFMIPFNVLLENIYELSLYHELIGHGTQAKIASNRLTRANNELHADICAVIAYAVCHNNNDACRTKILSRDKDSFNIRQHSSYKEFIYDHGWELEQAVDALARILANPEQNALIKLLTPHEIAMLGDYWTDPNLDRVRRDMRATDAELQNISAFAPPRAAGLAATEEQFMQRIEALKAIEHIPASKNPKPAALAPLQALAPDTRELALRFLHRGDAADAAFFQRPLRRLPEQPATVVPAVAPARFRR